jgi:hypothetical protein
VAAEEAAAVTMMNAPLMQTAQQMKFAGMFPGKSSA